jgi:hypothetical protein
MLEEIKRNDKKRKDFGTAMNMTAFEKKISFLNRYFIFKKKRDVNTQKVQLELGEYTEYNEEINNKETKYSIEIAEKEVKRSKPKIVKLNKKLLLVPATEITEEKGEKTKSKPIKPKPKKESKKKVLIIEDDDENDV